MNTFAAVVAGVLIYAVCQLQAACPSDRTSIGPCVNSLCPPGNYCNVDANGTTECCSGTDPKPCVDKLSDCSKNAAKCDVASYRVFMTTNCPKTCNRCGVTNCTDANTLCTVWAANKFCESTFYNETIKKDNCRATCGYC